MKEVGFYILISGDGYPLEKVNGGSLSAYKIAMSRLKLGYWPLNKHTRNVKSVKAGDICMIYIAGRKENARCIIGEASIKEVLKTVPKECVGNQLEQEYNIFSSSIMLEKFISYDKPINVKTILNKLEFVSKNKTKWGASFQGGCRKISKKDYETIKSQLGS